MRGIDLCIIRRMSKRMEVRRTGGRSFLVEDDGRVVGTYPGRAEAFKAVLELGGRVHLAWGRSMDGDKPLPKDFTASFEGENAGRIYFMQSDFAGGHWKAFPGGFNEATGRGGTGTQIVDTRDEAVAFIERRYTELMAGVEPKPLPNAYAKAKGL